MDKRTFIERAPIYYALAIATYFRGSGENSASDLMVQNYYFVHSEEESDPESGLYRLGNDVLFSRGALYLERAGLLELVLDDFGPPILQVRKGFESLWQSLVADRRSPFFRFQQLGEQAALDWLKLALDSVNEEYVRLGINQSDFDLPDTEWEPIPLDRDDTAFAKAQEALVATIEGLRVDNGYAASIPEEKDFVTGELTEATHKLSTAATVSRGFIRRKIIEPLGRIIVRFGKASLGVLAEAAKQAFTEWLRSKGINFLDRY